MLSMVLALAASMTAAQVPAQQADIAPIAAHGGCLPQLDPQFVRFVPPAPSSGPNPLFRLISGRGASPATSATRRDGACIRPLERTAFPR